MFDGLDDSSFELDDNISEESTAEDGVDETAPGSDDARKIPFKKNVRIRDGSYSFQIQLMDILENHGAELNP